ncbi:UDP-N-acetyl glucosamine 2-epimerase [Congregibacter brevis]|uniref:UDP-N-acetyl glucosamine 2-epimerase n=1 Tax=Congregibacter brevis TaxID=3081201 RepID=A0ABZ0IEF2_9GAMM|nr:UDP-N-acetyl glucosamine 2-epimerase [Congregibacter sp. IMCC45268]
MDKILTILGARPQFIKAATVSRALKSRNDLEEVIVHTGQHFDANMSEVFFDQLDIPPPNFNLGISGIGHGAMTGRMLEQIEALILAERPKWVLVYGDTNSTLAGALAAAKLDVPVAHVEAGLRSHNPQMPEEVNRILTDRISSLLLCPSDVATQNLSHEGFPFQATQRPRSRTNVRIDSGAAEEQRIEQVGDVMLDAVLHYRNRAEISSDLVGFNVQRRDYLLCTLHRQENTDDRQRLSAILSALRQIAMEIPIVLPLHPRTRSKLNQIGASDELKGLHILPPVPYLEMLALQMHSSMILTDSGGMQKEAYFHGVPCITLRDETEWVETVDSGWNQLVGADEAGIVRAWRETTVPNDQLKNLYGDGKASEKLASLL